MTATFGDLARLADAHLTAVIGRLAPRDPLSETAAATASELGHAAAALSRCVHVPGRADPGTDPLACAAVTARDHLRHAAAALLPPAGYPRRARPRLETRVPAPPRNRGHSIRAGTTPPTQLPAPNPDHPGRSKPAQVVASAECFPIVVPGSSTCLDVPQR